MPDSLSEMFSTLTPLPADEGDSRIRAVRVAEGQEHRLGISVHGAPIVLIHVAEHAGEVLPPILLEHLSLQHRVLCRLVGEHGEESEGLFTIVRSSEAAGGLHRYFLAVCETLLRTFGPSPDSETVSQELAKLVELFRRLSEPAVKTVQGLYAELLVIACAANPIAAAAAWHLQPRNLHDFTEGADRLEVKSAGGTLRRHRFSFEQLSVPDDVHLLVASVLMERIRHGVTLDALLGQVRRLTARDPATALHVDAVVAELLGDQLQKALVFAFDWERAVRSLRFYEGAVVPRPAVELPPGVSRVTFEADLSAVPSTIPDGGVFFRAVAPTARQFQYE